MITELQYETIKDCVKVYIKELSTTKKGKPSTRKYIKNRGKIFFAISMITDLHMEIHKDAIEKEMEIQLSQFAEYRVLSK